MADSYEVAYDLGMHAAEQALETLARILNTAPDGPTFHMAVAVAHAQLEWKLGAMDDEMDAVSPGFKQLVEGAKKVIADTSGKEFAEWAKKGREQIFGDVSR